ncbi:DNA mismatch repair protein MutT, partial [Streptomyces sp. NPDC059101]
GARPGRGATGPGGPAPPPPGKVVTVWAVAADLDPAGIEPGTFEMEWPRGSGVLRSFPEIDRVAWWAPEQARARLVAAQREFLDRLADVRAGGPGEAR